MNTLRASRDPGRFIVDYGRLIEPIACADESGLGEVNFMAGFRKAENDRYEIMEDLTRENECIESLDDLPREDNKELPSEIFSQAMRIRF